MKKIIFTDLDGTLLHPETYSFEAARPALDMIREEKIPLILCSSKTRAELLLYQKRLEIEEPFVSENGGGIFSPVGYFSSGLIGDAMADPAMVTLGMAYCKVRKKFLETRMHLGVSMRGFGDMSVEDVALLTGLPPGEAVLARQRDFSEPFVFEQSADERVFMAFSERGLTWTRGKLYCVMGQHDKGKAVRILKNMYEAEHGRMISIGLGDALNDLPMLQQVDLPILIPKHDGTYDPEVSLPGLRHARGVGPEGWSRAVQEALRS
jgi:mannosyl-3-phosphoglycerate phosphatase